MNPNIIIKLTLAIIIAVTIFHFSIILGFIPYEITWGGRIKNDFEMYIFETISILVNIILGLTLLIKGNYIYQIISPKAVDLILWIFLVLFGLNTIGNIFAETNFEKSFSILTLLLSIQIWSILKAKNNNHVTTQKKL